METQTNKPVEAPPPPQAPIEVTLSTALVSPSVLLADDNSRFGLRESGVLTLMEQIKAQGEVTVPLDVETLETPVAGKEYRVTDGHYRLEAVNRLAKEGFVIPLIPIVINPPSTPAERLYRQVSFNVSREMPTPMDQAVGMRKMLDAGVSRGEIRKLFKLPTGKAGSLRPCSNAHLNMVVRFLDFPKNIQSLIHEGVIGLKAAYTLYKKPKDKWAAIVDECKAELKAGAEAVDADEEKFLAGEKKNAEQEQKVKSAELAVSAAEEKVKGFSPLLDEKIQKEADALKAARTAKTAEEKKATAETLAAAQADVKAAQKLADDAAKEAQKTKEAMERLQKSAEERRKKLEDARKKAVKSKITPSAIDKAAAKGTGDGKVQPNIVQLRQAISEWALSGGVDKADGRVVAIFTIAGRYVSGELTINQTRKLMVAAMK